MKKILVVQFRTDQSEKHEQKCFLEVLGKNVKFINAVKNDLPENFLVNAIAVIFGGSGEFFLGQGDGKLTWREKTFKFIDKILEQDVPLFGICFGFQLIALYYGARIKNIEEMRETGTFETILLDQAYFDPIFKSMPEKFLAQFGHKETAINLPNNLIPLAKSKRVSCEAFRVKDKKIWSVLFHPELNKFLMKERISMFPNYLKEINDIDAYVEENFKNTPDAKNILKYFVDYAYHNK